MKDKFIIYGYCFILSNKIYYKKSNCFCSFFTSLQLILSAKGNLKDDNRKDELATRLKSDVFTDSSSTLNTFNLSTGVIVQNIIVNIHEATKYSRVFELKTFFEISRLDTSQQGIPFEENIMNITTKILKNAKTKTR